MITHEIIGDDMQAVVFTMGAEDEIARGSGRDDMRRLQQCSWSLIATSPRTSSSSRPASV